MHAFDVLGDPVRRRILELMAEGEQPAGTLAERIRAEFGISQPAVSQHLKVLRDNGFARARKDGTRRLYSLHPEALSPVEGWLDRIRRAFAPPLDALATEVARGKRARRLDRAGAATDAGGDPQGVTPPGQARGGGPEGQESRPVGLPAGAPERLPEPPPAEGSEAP